MEVWKILDQDNDKKSKQYNINITFAQILSFNKKRRLSCTGIISLYYEFATTYEIESKPHIHPTCVYAKYVCDMF